MHLLTLLLSYTLTLKEPTPSQPVRYTLRPAIMERIAKCESGDRHFDEKGNVVRGKQNPDDVGRYQINEFYHAKEAKAMGLDLLDEQDNETFALHLYQEKGSQPWAWSKNCWSK